jgi:hypothetical protein
LSCGCSGYSRYIHKCCAADSEVIEREDHEKHDDDPQKKDENREKGFEQEIGTQALWSMGKMSQAGEGVSEATSYSTCVVRGRCHLSGSPALGRRRGKESRPEAQEPLSVHPVRMTTDSEEPEIQV